MPSRREFIQAGLAVSVAPIAIPIGQSASPVPRIETATPAHHPLYCVVCDTRFSWSTDLAREGERLGIKVARTHGDITDFWFNDLSQRWKQTPAAIAGLTAEGPLFCLERFGWDHGLRVVFRGTHRWLDTGHVEHAMSGPARTIAAVRQAGLGGTDWPRHVARLLNSCAAAGASSSTTVRSELTRDRDVDVHDTLVSWVIAPKRAA